MNKEDAKNKEAIYKQLTRLKENGEKPYQVEFGSAGRGISHQVMSEIVDEKLPGILFVNDLKRYYPNGIFASHLIGFAVKRKIKIVRSQQKVRWGLN